MVTSIDTVELSAGALLSAPNVSRLTTQSLEGTGVFDVLMASTKLHLLEEYNSGRITGEEYTQVYLGALTAVMQQSVTFLLNSQQEEKIIAEIGLVRQKIATELAQTDNTIPLGLAFNGTSVVEGLVESQLALNALQEDLVTNQIEKVERESALVGQQIISELSHTSNSLTNAIGAGLGYNNTTTVAGLIKAQKDKVDAEIARSDAEVDLVTQKIVTEVAQTSDTKPVGLGQMSSTTVLNGLVKSQKEKTDAEIILLSQKAITELSQTSDTVTLSTPALNTSGTVSGVVTKQKDLLTAQTNGFARDAEQKLAKIIADTWSVSATMDAATANTTNKLDDTSVGAVMTKAMTGIGV